MNSPNVIDVDYDDTKKILLHYRLRGVETAAPKGLEAQVTQKVMKSGKRCIVKRANLSADSAGKEFTTELIEINHS